MKIRKILESGSLFEPSDDYIIREVKKDHYQIAKFTHGKAPSEVYDITHFSKDSKWFCNCPSRIKPCKHIDMVRQWIKDGKKMFFDLEKNKEFLNNIFNKEK